MADLGGGSVADLEGGDGLGGGGARGGVGGRAILGLGTDEASGPAGFITILL